MKDRPAALYLEWGQGWEVGEGKGLHFSKHWVVLRASQATYCSLKDGKRRPPCPKPHLLPASHFHSMLVIGSLPNL